MGFKASGFMKNRFVLYTCTVYEPFYVKFAGVTIIEHQKPSFAIHYYLAWVWRNVWALALMQWTLLSADCIRKHSTWLCRLSTGWFFGVFLKNSPRTSLQIIGLQLRDGLIGNIGWLSWNAKSVSTATQLPMANRQNDNNGKSNEYRSAGFTDFCFNYANERLHNLHYNSAFTNPMELYKMEQVRRLQDHALLCLLCNITNYLTPFRVSSHSRHCFAASPCRWLVNFTAKKKAKQ